MKSIELILLFTTWITCLTAQERFPSRDSKEWNNLTVAQRWQAVNIPQDQLNKMTTNDLIEHCINFDFMWDIFNYTDYSTGLNVVIENHNGLRELLNRKDAGKLILSYYKKIDLNGVTDLNDLVGRGEFVAKIFFLELFLSHPNILSQFHGNEKELIKTILMSHDICLDINAKTGKDFYSGYSIGTKVLAIGKALAYYKGIRIIAPAVDQMDLSKLSNERYKVIIDEARNYNYRKK
jgi:hypothetical protein